MHYLLVNRGAQTTWKASVALECRQCPGFSYELFCVLIKFHGGQPCLGIGGYFFKGGPCNASCLAYKFYIGTFSQYHDLLPPVLVSIMQKLQALPRFAIY